ncbi:MAG: rhamnulose-1-phosphate aldolase [Lachnospiraceae bacterium]|nr:rhamnulose-1-phosphate aldolase [Lachnospiraceae bacterium]
MKVIETEWVQGFIRMCSDGFEQGWHERNGGNLSYRIRPEEINEVRDIICDDREWTDIGTTVASLAGEYFLVTGSGKYFRNVSPDPEANICIIKVNEDGTKYKILWGLCKGGRPTSELPSHLMNLEVCKKRDENIRVVYHCHPANIIALTYVLPLEDRVFTRELWEMATECPVVFPQGVGVVPWMVPGGRDIAIATSEIMKERNVAIWAHHGCFACGEDFDISFGLMHTVEKAAEVLVKVMSMTDRKLQTIQPEDFRALNEPFGIKVDERFLYEKKSDIIGRGL